MTGPDAITCPCGGHTLRLTPDKPPVGGRAAFTCPACGQRRAFTRTAEGAVFDPAPDTAPAASPVSAPAAVANKAVLAAPPQTLASLLPDPRPAPAGAAVVLAALAREAWRNALEQAFPAPDWHILAAAPETGQNLADVRGLAPAVIVAEDGPVARELTEAVSTVPGRQRERMALLLIGEYGEGDALAAFAAGADAVIDGRIEKDLAKRLRAAWDRKNSLPSLYDGTP